VQRVLESILAAINPFFHYDAIIINCYRQSNTNYHGPWCRLMQLLLTATDNLIPMSTNLDLDGPNALTQAVDLTYRQQLHCKGSDRRKGLTLIDCYSCLPIMGVSCTFYRATRHDPNRWKLILSLLVTTPSGQVSKVSWPVLHIPRRD
jgi:hypothetical protein